MMVIWNKAQEPEVSSMAFLNATSDGGMDYTSLQYGHTGSVKASKVET
jgi:hypothetical protein